MLILCAVPHCTVEGRRGPCSCQAPMQAPGVWGNAGGGPGSSIWAAGIMGVPPEPPSRAIRARRRVCPGVFWKVPAAQGLRSRGARVTQRLKPAVLLLWGRVVRGISHKESSGVWPRTKK